MNDDRPADNLRRILLDGLRLDAGERRVDELLAAGRLPGPVGVVMVDIDSSAAIRARGIAAKIELVLACRTRLSGVVPGDAVIVDSGTRDETYLVLPACDERGALAVAEAVRGAVAAQPFTLDGFDSPLPVTVSAGYLALDQPRRAGELFAAAREALHEAKRLRDCARTTRLRTEPVAFAAPRHLLAALAEAGVPPERAVADGLRLVEQKYTGIRHWAVTQTEAAAGRLPELELPGTDAAPAADVVFFGRMVWSAVFEALLAARRSAGTATRVAVHDHRPPAGICVRYLPGVWLALHGTGQPGEPGAALDLVHAARCRAEGADVADTVPVTVAVLPSATALLRKIGDAQQLSETALLTEALRLCLDRLACRRLTRSAEASTIVSAPLGGSHVTHAHR